MNGLDLSRAFYSNCVRQIIAEHMPDLTEKYAAGLIGYGSDVIGNDDALSRDHEWGPRLVLFLGDMNHQRVARQLDNLLNEKIPATFQGFSTRFEYDDTYESLVMTAAPGGRHHITITTPERFIQSILGSQHIPQDDVAWLLIPEQRLLEFTSGEIFSDPVGEITEHRTRFSYFPDNVWKYRLSYLLEALGWELDLIPLCGKRGDMLSMHLNTAVTVERIIRLVFLLNRRFCPGYAKWLHREFSKLSAVAGDIEPFLHAAFQSKDYMDIAGNIDHALERVYSELRNVCGLPELPSDPPRTQNRGSIFINMRQPARIILGSIPGPLGELRIHGAPYGAVDQWITHEDMLLSPEYLRSLLSLYHTKES